MKNINEYIQEIINHKHIFNDILDDIVYEHIDMHYRFNYRLINEDSIYESDGSFPNQHNIIIQILNELSGTEEQTYKIKLNSFVQDLYIHFKTNKESGIEGMYIIDNEKYSDYNDIRWDNENNSFRFAEIIIYNYDKDPCGLEEILYHETKHIWDDYISKIKNDKLLSEKVKKSLNVKLNKSNIDETLKQIIYYCEDYEISSYITQLNGIFGNKKFLTIDDAFDEIKRSSVYQNYKFCYYVLISDKYKERFLETITLKEYKRLQNNIKRAWKKIINHSYLICCSHLTNLKLNPSNKKLIK